jgi:hypothetical protein
MKSLRIVVAGVLLSLTTVPMAAQGPTAAGVDAFVRGDYARAFDILQPIAESPWSRDPVADYFFGALYENGLGLPADAMRACSHYHRAASARTTALGRHADGLLRLLWIGNGNDWWSDCQLFAGIGYDHGFQPVVFVLGPGHSVAWDLKGATITYQGREKRLDLPLAANSGGLVFLPLEHVELTGGPTRSTRRHFIEIFTWTPAKQPDNWLLRWRVLEVVRDTLEDVTQGELLTLNASKPPSGTSYSARDVAYLSVNDAGDAEWTIAGGPKPRTGIIESETERLEALAVRAAKAEADARFDPARRREVNRTPALVYSEVAGCGHIFLHAWSADRTEAIVVSADRNSLQLGTTEQTFDAGTPRRDLEVLVHVYGRALRSGPFCTDVGMPPLSEEVWRLTSGTITIELSAPGIRRQAPYVYQATVRIVDGEFTSASGRKVKRTSPLILAAMVGTVS